MIEHLLPILVAKRYIFELKAGAGLEQGHSLRVVAQIMWDEQGLKSLRQARHVLDHVDERDRKVACRVQHRKPERARKHDVASGDSALLPKGDGPSEQGDREGYGYQRVQDAQPLEIE